MKTDTRSCLDSFIKLIFRGAFVTFKLNFVKTGELLQKLFGSDTRVTTR